MTYPTTYERYHVYQSTSATPIVCETLPIALQLMSSFAAGTIGHVEKVVETHTVYAIYGTATNPLPPAPNPVIPTNSAQITHIKHS